MDLVISNQSKELGRLLAYFDYCNDYHLLLVIKNREKKWSYFPKVTATIFLGITVRVFIKNFLLLFLGKVMVVIFS